MQRKTTFGLVLLLFVLSIGIAAAQGGGGGFGRGGFGGGGGLRMLRIPEVQQELKMTPDQISKIADEQQTVQDGMQDIMQNAGGNPQDMTPAQRADLGQKIQDLNDKAVGDILTDPAQLKRYHELALQRAGAGALAQKSVQDQLNLTDAQRKQITDIQTKSQADAQAARQAAGDFQSMSDDDRQKFFAKMTSITNDTNTKLMAVLTDSQKAQWKTMQGAPFTFPAGGGFGGGGRRGGGGGGAGGGGAAGGGNAAVQ
jgi:Spy/CpxP family protein refolding chaperone